MTDANKIIYGLIGHPLTHSFSYKFFNDKFKNEQINAEYRNFDIDSIIKLTGILNENVLIQGLNVTIPYKQQIIPYLTEIAPSARDIGAVNVIKIKRLHDKIITKGYNSDVIGFANSLMPMLKSHHSRALILGTGGASKAVAYVFERLGIQYKFVSRTTKSADNTITYSELNESVISTHTIIVNATPLGMFPHINECPDIPYEFITDKHICFDLIYNPGKTEFLKYSEKQGAEIKNGMEMLKLQALESWRIWNGNNEF